MLASPMKQSACMPDRGTGWWLIILLVIATMLCLGLGTIVCQSRARAMTCWEKVGDFSNATVVNSMCIYQNKLYVGLNDLTVRRYNSSAWQNTGFVGIGNGVPSSLTTFNNLLYLGTYNDTTGTEVWTYDGSSWSQINIDGFGSGSTVYACNTLAVYDNQLYAGTEAFGGGRVYRYDGGTSWTAVSPPWDNQNDPLCAISWNGYLWVGTENTTTGTEIWRYDGTNWTQANTNGFGVGAKFTFDFCIHNNQLYCGTGQMARVFRHNSDTSWSQIGSIGLNDIDNNYNTGCLTSLDGKLYATTTTPYGAGCQVRSWNGSSWVSENTPGFGDPETSEAHASTVFNSRLYIGTTGATAQVWRSTDTPVPYSVYLAEGSTDWGYSCYISIENPQDSPVTVKMTYQTRDGPVAGPEFEMPASSQATVNPYETVGNTDFSTKVECLEGKTISADRTMTWVGTGAPCEEAHNSVGVTSPDTTWYLPEGSSSWGFETWTLVQNPNDRTANVTLTYMIENEGPTDVQVSVGPNSRGTWSVEEHIGKKDASIMVTSDEPVIGERAMYRNSRREGHDSVGATSAAGDYYLAEGCTGFGFTTYVLVQNPQGETVDVDITYMTGAGPVSCPTFQMSPGTRKTINVNETISLPDPNFSTQVHGSKPIIAERAMYWDGGPDNAEVCHDSIGMSEPHSTFYLPDGETGNGRETWTLVQNPNASSAEVRITYLTPTGEGNVTFTDTVPANSRKTYAMDGSNGYPSISGRAAIMVESLDSEKKIMCERSMYWNSRGAGTDTVGGWAD